MRMLFLAGALAFSGFIQPALSANCDPADETQTGMNLCASAQYEVEDAKLNKAYHEVMKRLDAGSQDRKKLQMAQRAWIAFRDAECAFSASDSEGGSIYPMLVSLCLAELTTARTAQLNAYMECTEGDVDCQVQ